MKKLFCTLLAAALLLTLCACAKKQPSSPPTLTAPVQTQPEQETPTWQSQYDLGVRYLSEGNYQEAVLAFTAAIEIDPKNPQAYEGRGDAYWALAQTEAGDAQISACRSAAEDYASAMRYGEETDDLRRRAGDAYFGAQDYEKAVPYYDALRETDDEALERLMDCYRELGREEELAALLQRLYTETGSESYLQTLYDVWPQDALQSYGEILGANGTMGFALVDLDLNGVPELICGEIDTKGYSEQIALTDYTLYTWQNGQAVELYQGFVDTWRNPDVCVTPAGAVVNEGHGSSAGYELQYVRWDGEQIETHDFYGYDSETHGYYVYFIDLESYSDESMKKAEVSEEDFYERLDACTEGKRVLVFLPSTRENIEGLLHAQNIKALPTREEVEAALYPNVWWLNECAQETFGVTLGEGGISNYGPAGISCTPITNYASTDEIRQAAGYYVAQDFLYRLDENVSTIEGIFGLVRGGRGYGMISYDPSSIYVVSYDETSCIAQCTRCQFDEYDGTAQLHLTYQGDHWLLTQVLVHGSTDVAFDEPYWG